MSRIVPMPYPDRPNTSSIALVPVNPGRIPVEMIEVQRISYLDEDDIARFEDSYGRSAPINAKVNA
jgi:hypothetical protein